MKFKWKKRYTIAVIVAIVGALLTVLSYFATDTRSRVDVAVITDSKIKDTLIEKSEDVYKNADETRQQILHLKFYRVSTRAKLTRLKTCIILRN